MLPLHVGLNPDIAPILLFLPKLAVLVMHVEDSFILGFFEYHVFGDNLLHLNAVTIVNAALTNQ